MDLRRKNKSHRGVSNFLTLYLQEDISYKNIAFVYKNNSQRACKTLLKVLHVVDKIFVASVKSRHGHLTTMLLVLSQL